MELDFSYKPDITKDYLLKYNTEEAYMEYYLGVKVSKKLICNPLRKDKNPTASFFRTLKENLYSMILMGAFMETLYQ